MGMQRIKEKLHKVLFPSFHTTLDDLRKLKQNLYDDREKIVGENVQLRNKISLLEQSKKPTLADLMRENLGGAPINYSDADDKGNPPHYLAGLNAEGQEAFYARLNEVYMNQEFQSMLKYLIDAQGNFSLRNALNWDQDIFGRATINGYGLVRKELITAHLKWEEAHKPPDPYDEHEVM